MLPAPKALLMPTIGLQWLTEPFFCAAGRKILPDQHGQQDLSAAPDRAAKNTNHLTLLNFSTWHGFRYCLP